MSKKNDYKDYVYLRLPISEYNEIMEGKKRLKKVDFKRWVDDYYYKQAEKRAYAKIANEKKIAQAVKKLYKALEDYYTTLFKEEKKELSINKLSKLAGVNYRTASKFWKENNLQDWLKKFEKNHGELKNFYCLLADKYNYFD